MSIEGEADALGVVDPDGEGEALLAEADGVAELEGVELAVGSSSPPPQPARARVTAAVADAAYVKPVRDFIVRNPSVVRRRGGNHAPSRHRVCHQG
jgi:hypothetical protein